MDRNSNGNPNREALAAERPAGPRIPGPSPVGYLRRHGAAPDCVARMLRELLPEEVRRELESLLDSPRDTP